MMRFDMTVFLLCAAATGWAQRTEVSVPSGNFVPAGTLLGCTLDEPNFSSQTARYGDPVLCKTSSVEMFGQRGFPGEPIFPLVCGITATPDTSLERAGCNWSSPA